MGWFILLRFVWIVDHWLNAHPKSGPQVPDTRLCLVYWGHRHHKEALTVPPCSLTTVIASRTLVILRVAESKINHHCSDTAWREGREKKPWGTVTTDMGWWIHIWNPFPALSLLWHYQGSALSQSCSHIVSFNAGLVLQHIVLARATAAKTSLRAKG